MGAAPKDKLAQLLSHKDVWSFSTIEYHDSISSTNDRAKKLFETGVLSELPGLVVAASQTAGRGRGGKTWWSGRGALLASLGLNLKRINRSRKELPLISLATGLSIAEALRERIPGENQIGIHWPNDVYLDDKKIAGILIESPCPQGVVIGFGVNVNNRSAEIPVEYRSEFREKPIGSLIDILDKKTDIFVLIVDILSRLQYNLEYHVEYDVESGVEAVDRSSNEFIRRVESICIQIDREIETERNGRTIRGRCLGINPDGSLRLRTDLGMETLHSGIVRRKST